MIYAQTPNGPVFEGDVYSSAVFPQLERPEWLRLDHLRAEKGLYRLTVANEDQEIQYINQMELIAVDHAAGMLPVFDQGGRLHLLTRPESPVSAVDLRGHDAGALIAAKDDRHWPGPVLDSSELAEQGLILEFQRPPDAENALLTIRARNTPWQSYSLDLLCAALDKKSASIQQEFFSKDAAGMQQWMLDRQIPLSVWLETSPGQWQRAGYFQPAGPRGLKDDVLALDLSQAQGDRIRIKLSSGFMFWEIDYAALDFAAIAPPEPYALPMLTAKDQSGNDLQSYLRSADDQYYVQPAPGLQAQLSFQAPAAEPAPGKARSLFLHAQGYYTVLRHAEEGKSVGLK